MKRAMRPRRPRARGFTLIEMMAVLAVSGILLALAVPSYNDAVLGMKLGTYANDLVASTLQARGEAIKRNAVVTLCVSSDGATCRSGGWEQGWIVMCNTSDQTYCDPDGEDTLVLNTHAALPSGWKISEADDIASILFQPSGTGATSATLTVCRASPSVGAQERVARISASGRPSVSKTSNADCP